MRLLRIGYKRLWLWAWVFCLSLIIHSGGSQLLTPEDTRTAYEEAHVVRYGGLWPIASMEQRLSNNPVSDIEGFSTPS